MKFRDRLKSRLTHLQTEIVVKRDQFLGYIGKDGEPLKCTCGCRDLEQCNEDWLNGRAILLEYDYRCKKCGKILNHWAYGHWQFY